MPFCNFLFFNLIWFNFVISLMPPGNLQNWAPVLFPLSEGGMWKILSFLTLKRMEWKETSFLITFTLKDLIQSLLKGGNSYSA